MTLHDRRGLAVSTTRTDSLVRLEQATEPTASHFIDQSATINDALGATANERERMHAAAARAWLEGDFQRSLRFYVDLAVEYPRDLLALQTSQVSDFFLGQSFNWQLAARAAAVAGLHEESRRAVETAEAAATAQRVSHPIARAVA